MNRAVWKFLISTMSFISDNTYVITILITITFAIIAAFIFRNYVNFIPIIATGYMFSLAYAIRDLPFVHKRIHTALDITADIVLASKNYTTSFSNATNIIEPTKLKIINILYSLEYKNNLLNTDPKDLYEHFYSTMDKTRLGFLGYIDTNIIYINSYIVVLIICLLSLGLYLLIKRKKIFRVYMEVTLVVIGLFFSIGVAINMVIFIILERIYVFSFKNFKIPKKNKAKKTY